MGRDYGKQQELTYLSSILSKLLKQKFGKGPEACISNYNGNYILVHIKSFITAAEEVLLGKDETNLALTFRIKIVESIIEEFIQEVPTVLGANMNKYYHNWNYHTNTGIVLLEKQDCPTSKIDSSSCQNILQISKRIMSEIHRLPRKMNITKINPKIYVVECIGVLFGFEKAVAKKGYNSILIEREINITHELHKYQYKRKDFFKDIFIHWDYEEDRCLLVYYLE